MGIRQEKDIIVYKGSKYNWTYNLTTRKADGNIERLTAKSSIKNMLEYIVAFYLRFPNADGFYETLIKNAFQYTRFPINYWNWYSINDEIENIKKNYHKIYQYAKDKGMTITSPHLLLHCLSCYDLTEMELAFWENTHITNRQVLKKYAYQYVKYKNFLYIRELNSKINAILMVDGKIEMPSNLLDFCLKTSQRYQEIEDISAIMQMQRYYERNKQYNFEDEKYVYIVPSTTQQVKDEGEMQSNCVYSIYYRHMLRDSYNSAIIFVRDKENPNQSLYTIEYNKESRIFTQCYGYRNSQVDKDIVNHLFNQISQR